MKSSLILRILAAAGFAISAYLLVQKLTGKIDSIVGCGSGSGCSNVLGSRWSQFFSIPVTAFAALMYAALFAATWKPSRPLYAALMTCLAGAALWFFGVLFFDLKEFCPWCTSAHLIGLASAAVLFFSLRKPDLKGNPMLGIAGGGAALLVLILGQLFGPIPDTHLESGGKLAGKGDGSVHAGNPGNASASGRLVYTYDRSKAYHTGTLPHLGSADAPHVLVKYFDFTCEACRDMDEDLHFVMEKHPDKFCLILLPVPLNRACNPHFPPDVENHEHACELARLGLAAWRANPEAFAEVQETLFQRPVLPPEIAEIAVAQIVGEEALAKALNDPWIDEILAANKDDFRQLIVPTIKMPKLIMVGKGRMFHGLTRNKEVLLQSLEKGFSLAPSE